MLPTLFCIEFCKGAAEENKVGCTYKMVLAHYNFYSPTQPTIYRLFQYIYTIFHIIIQYFNNNWRRFGLNLQNISFSIMISTFQFISNKLNLILFLVLYTKNTIISFKLEWAKRPTLPHCGYAHAHFAVTLFAPAAEYGYEFHPFVNG